jgi:hypothetical protein
MICCSLEFPKLSMLFKFERLAPCSKRSTLPRVSNPANGACMHAHHASSELRALIHVQVPNPDDRRTWGDCWRCEHFVYACKLLSHVESQALGGCAHNRIPHVATMPLTQYGLYAAQIAWWLSFFPPESFMIVTREELRDSKRVLPVCFQKFLSRFMAHALMKLLWLTIVVNCSDIACRC